MMKRISWIILLLCMRGDMSLYARNVECDKALDVNRSLDAQQIEQCYKRALASRCSSFVRKNKKKILGGTVGIGLTGLWYAISSSNSESTKNESRATCLAAAEHSGDHCGDVDQTSVASRDEDVHPHISKRTKAIEKSENPKTDAAQAVETLEEKSVGENKEFLKNLKGLLQSRADLGNKQSRPARASYPEVSVSNKNLCEETFEGCDDVSLIGSDEEELNQEQHAPHKDLSEEEGVEHHTEESSAAYIEEELNQQQDGEQYRNLRRRLQDQISRLEALQRGDRAHDHMRENGKCPVPQEYVRKIADELAVKAPSYRTKTEERERLFKKLVVARVIECDESHVEALVASVDSEYRESLISRLNNHREQDMQKLKREALEFKIEELMMRKDVTKEEIEKDVASLKKQLCDHESQEFVSEVEEKIKKDLTPYQFTYIKGVSRCTISAQLCGVPYFDTLMKSGFRESLSHEIQLPYSAEDVEWVLNQLHLCKSFDEQEIKGSKPLAGRNKRRLAALQEKNPLTFEDCVERGHIASYFLCPEVMEYCAHFFVDYCARKNLEPQFMPAELQEEDTGKRTRKQSASMHSDDDGTQEKVVDLGGLDEFEKAIDRAYCVEFGESLANKSFDVNRDELSANCAINDEGVPCRKDQLDSELEKIREKNYLFELLGAAVSTGVVDKNTDLAQFRQLVKDKIGLKQWAAFWRCERKGLSQRKLADRDHQLLLSFAVRNMLAHNRNLQN